MYNDKINGLIEAYNLSPDNFLIKKLLADVFYEYGYYNESRGHYESLISDQPDDYNLRLIIAEVYIHLSEYHDANVVLDFLIQKQPSLAKAYILKAKVFLNDNNMIQAKELYDYGLGLDISLKDISLDSALAGIIKVNQGGEMFNETDDRYGDDSDDIKFLDKKVEITFKDVGGMEELKEKIRLKIIYPIQQSEIYKKYGKKIGGGILLYGPPGCGKTYIAKATAGELNSRFIHVALSDIFDMYFGESEKKLKSIFEMARNNTPCVIFFDEIDALASKRSDASSGTKHLVNQFLVELDGMQGDNEGVLVIGSTNAPRYIDSAFKRPGRFDSSIFVSPPDAKSREEIFNIKLVGKPLGNIDLKKLASVTQKYSGADIELVIDNAIEKKLSKSFTDGIIMPLETKDILIEAKSTKPSTVEWFGTAKNYATYANESGIYDEILDYLK